MSEQVVEEQPQKDYETILEQQMTAAERELARPASGLLMSALSAGLDVGFGPLLMGVILTLGTDAIPELLLELLLANAYAVGFVFVIMGRSELFTEHTTLAVLPVLDRRATVGSLARLWGLVYVANLVGAAVFVLLASRVAPGLGIVDPASFGVIAGRLVRHTWWLVLASGILAGWMMGLLSWLLGAGRDTISQLFFVWLVTASIGLAGFHHSIAGTVEVLLGVFVRSGATWADFGHFLLWSTVGNAVGGTVFVALIKYGHVIRPGKPA